MKKIILFVALTFCMSSLAYGKHQVRCGDTIGVYGIELDIYPTVTFFSFSADGMESSDIKRSVARVISRTEKVTVFHGVDHDGDSYLLPIPTKYLRVEGEFKIKVGGNSPYLEDTDSIFECESRFN